MILSKQDRDDPLWVKLKADAETRLAQLRIKNDTNMSELATAELRGAIKEIKRFLSQGEEKPLIEVE